MKRQWFASQRSLSRLFQEGAEAWKRQKYQQTIKILEPGAKRAGELHRRAGVAEDWQARCARFRVSLANREFSQAIGRRSPFQGVAGVRTIFLYAMPPWSP